MPIFISYSQLIDRLFTGSQQVSWSTMRTSGLTPGS